MPLTAFFAPADRRTVADALEEMFQTPATCTLKLDAPAGIARPPLEGRLVLLPLKSDLGDVSRALGCLVSKGEIGSGPRRFSVTGHRFAPLTPGTAPAPRPAPKPPAPSESHGAPGFEAPATPFEAKNKRPPYLRLVKSDD